MQSRWRATMVMQSAGTLRMACSGGASEPDTPSSAPALGPHPAAQLVRDPPRPPPRIGPPQLKDQRPGLGRQPRRGELRTARRLHQPLDALGLEPRQPVVHRLARRPELPGHLRDEHPSRTSSTARCRCSTRQARSSNPSTSSATGRSSSTRCQRCDGTVKDHPDPLRPTCPGTKH